MKYRIKIYTFKNGRQEFEAQVKKRFGWQTINSAGEALTLQSGFTTYSREQALQRIDLHIAGNTSISSIEFEYITK